MKRPTWATIVGVLGIILSCFGILGAGHDMVMPKMMEFQKEMFVRMEEIQKKEAQRKGSESVPDEAFTEMSKMMEKMWSPPDWFGVWSIILGLSRLVICGFALFAYICLLQVKPVAIKLVYWAVGLSIVLALLKGVVTMASISLMAMAVMFGGVFGLVVNVVLIMVVALGDKSAFYQKRAPAV